MAKFDYKRVADPTFFKENVLPVHADFITYASMEELEQNVSSLHYSLNGLWKFHYAKNYVSTISGFEKTDYDASGWDDIRVPAHMQMEGYDVPAYINVQYPWDGSEDIKLGQVPQRFNPVGSYIKEFEIPDNFAGKRVHANFQGVESGFALWINGKYVGYSEDTFTPSEFDITDFLKKGTNKMAVQVYKWTASSFLEDQDFFRFSGIYRDVELVAIPEAHVEDLKIRTLLDDKYKDADLEVTVTTAAQKGTIAYTLSRVGKEVCSGEVKNKDNLIIKEHIKEPLLWSAEKPNLYQLTLQVKDSKGKVCEVIRENVGFRRFEMKNGIMCINGKRIVFKGVNRHEFSCDTGRVVNYEEVVKDVQTMKANNINAIRTSHYQNAPYIYRLCDIYGLYMIAENNMETHGTWAIFWKYKRPISESIPGDRDECMDMMLDRVNSTYQLDKNHPSVVIWSVGNESFGGKVIYEMSQKFRSLDSDRLVHYEGIVNDRRYPDTSDMESQMYPSVERIKKFLAENKEKPFICCEYTHAMANSCGGMFKYTDLTDEDPRYQGGFIWDYVDQSIRSKNRYGEEYQAYGGDSGERPTDYNFSGNGIVDGTRTPYAKMQEVKFNYQNITANVVCPNVEIINKNLFTGTDEYDCLIVLERDGVVIATAALETAVKPLSKKSYKLPAVIVDKIKNDTVLIRNDEKVIRHGEYAITVSFRLKEENVWGKVGHEVAYGQQVISDKVKAFETKKKIETVIGDYNIGIRGDNFTVLFSREGKGLTSYRYGGKELIEMIPRPNFWRAPTDNDGGNRMAARYGQWKLASDYCQMGPVPGEKGDGKDYPIIKKKATEVTLTYKYYLPTTPRAEVLVDYTVYGDGRIAVAMDYKGNKKLPPMPEFGMMFKFNADYSNMTYYGRGPAENYNDRNKGARLGIFTSKVSDCVEKYLVPQETGNRTDVRWAKVTDNRGRGLLFEAENMNFSALPYTPDELENAAHPYELPPVHYTVVRASMLQMGVGGDDSWGSRTHEEFLLPNDKKLHFEFSFRGI
ncbi:MAG: DUF4981 domain-containing protein [Butyrivibrio sp.]|nr:DUF4981 domain-containing protein [Butyrivibrio sp.]